MLRKYIALGVALVLLLGVTACGSKGDEKPSKDPVTTTTTVAGVTDSTTTVLVDGTTVTNGDTTAVGTKPTTAKPTEAPTTQYIPGGTQVPIGTRPPTTTKKPTTTTTVVGNTTAGNGTTASTAVTTTTTTTAPTTTAKPTNPPADQHYIALPEIGTDIDVTKKKDRIRVSDALAWYNEDGTIGVSLTFKNYTSGWITEETDYVQYTCYDKSGKVLKRENIMIGVIDTKKYSVKTYIFNVPADTYEVKLTRSKITYWTEWA